MVVWNVEILVLTMAKPTLRAVVYLGSCTTHSPAEENAE
jgi:hypothetical protein